jgi:hypothetical protein
MQVSSASFAPESFKTLQVGVVSGKLTVRSCSKAKNISISVRAYAHSEELLNTMAVEVAEDVDSSVYRVVVAQPAFDWRHCQHSWVDVIVPENAELDIDAQLLVGHVEIEASNNALKNVHVLGKVAYINVHDVNASGAITLASTLGYLKVKEVSAQSISTQQGVGILSIHDITAPVLESGLDIGTSCAGNLKIEKISIASEIGYFSLWNIDSANVTAFVEYGKISVAPVSEFEGHFNAVSPYGFIEVDHGTQTGDIVLSTNSTEQIEGTIGALDDTADGTPAVVRDVSISSIYGAVKFFVPNPHSKWWKEHHEEKKSHH